MAVKWSRVAPYLENGYASEGRVERSGIVDRMYDEGADDDVVDTVDALGSRVFNSVEDARQFLLSQGLVEE
jgi:hypothetical protein